MTRRPRTRLDGEGTVFEINTKYGKRWRAQKVVYRSSSGKYVKVSGQGLTPAQAVERREKRILELQVKRGELPPSALPHSPSELSLTVEDWMWQWYRAQPTEGREQSVAQYERRIRLHIAPHIGHIPLKALTPEDIEAWLKTLREKRKVVRGEVTNDPLLSGTAIKLIYHTLTPAMREAMRLRLITVNPCDTVRKPSKSKPRDQHIKDRTWYASHIMKALEGKPEECNFALRALYGLRTSELLGLTDDCFRLGGKTPSMTIKQQLAYMPAAHGCGERDRTTNAYPCGNKVNRCPQKAGGYLYIKDSTKTETSERELLLVEPALTLVRKHLERQRELRNQPGFKPLKGEKMDKLLFTRADGKPRRHQYETQWFRELFESLGIPPITPHAFRHIAITNIVSEEVGGSYDAAKAVAGHASITQSEAYSHPELKVMKGALTKYGRLLTSEQASKQEDITTLQARIDQMAKELAAAQALLAQQVEEADSVAEDAIEMGTVTELRPAIGES